MASTTENGAAQKYLIPERGGLTIDRQLSGSLEFGQQVEQQQHGLESCFGGREFLQTKIVRPQVMLQLADALLHVGPSVIVSPNLFWGCAAGSDEDAETVSGNIHQELTGTALFPDLFAYHHKPP